MIAAVVFLAIPDRPGQGYETNARILALMSAYYFAFAFVPGVMFAIGLDVTLIRKMGGRRGQYLASAAAGVGAAVLAVGIAMIVL